MWTAFGFILLASYGWFWYKKPRLAAYSTGIFVCLGALIFAGFYYWNDFQKSKVNVSVEYTLPKLKIQDTETGKIGRVNIGEKDKRKSLDQIFSDSGKSQLTREEKIELLSLIEEYEQFPLKVTITNNSVRQILRTSFTIGIFAKGRSTDLSKYESYESDKILNPGESDTTRWRVPSKEDLKNPEDYEYRVKYKHVNFK